VAGFFIAVALSASLCGAEPAEPAGAPQANAPPGEKGRKKKGADAAEAFFTTDPIPRLRIELTRENLDKLRREGRSYVEATVRETSVGGKGPEVVYEKVGLHLKGGAGSYRGIDDRPGLTLNFGKYTPGARFHGLRKIHLNNSVQDGSYMSENLGNAIFRDAGIPATRVTYARLWINGRDLGVFVLKEGFADAFLQRFFDDPTGVLYEGAFKDLDGGLPERVNKEAKRPEQFKELIAAAREGDAAARREKLRAVLDVDRFLTFMAMEAMTAHWDGYCPNVNNYRVYFDPAVGRFVFLPHGTDQLFQNSGFELVPGRGMVARALTAAPEDRAKYLERVAELRQKVFMAELIDRRLDEIAARLEPALAELGPDAARQHKERTEDLRRRIDERLRDVDRQLGATPRPLSFDPGGVALLTKVRWQQRNDGGNATLGVDNDGGHKRLHIRHEGGGECVASFRTTVTLGKGSYVFEGPCKTAGVTAPQGQNTGAGLRISGGRRDERRVGDSDWQPARFAFEVSEASRDVVLVCELRAGAGEAWFDAAGLKLRRK
jgi:spore coat protein CotH